jgi:2-polyprenyl-3-methyl-5-hydroxy-6-metoxy-1,4-benzoquinol methylase
MLTPSRRRGHEIIDDPYLEAGLITRSLRDVAVANTLFGGRRAVLRELDATLGALGGEATLLDVGTGLGDIPLHARRLAARRGVRLTTMGVELSAPLAAASRASTGLSICADAFRLPLRDRSIDVVTCSQVLHHFAEPDGVRLLTELSRVARTRVIVSDLRRSWLAAAGFWLASWPLGFHPISRHDGVLSVLRGFTADELRAQVRDAGGASPRVRHRLGWRVTAAWTPATAPQDVSPVHAPRPTPPVPPGRPAHGAWRADPHPGHPRIT